MMQETTLAGTFVQGTPAETRDIGIITMEIKTLHRQAQQVVLGYAIEIGRRLREAKEQLPHGKWGEWLKTEVEFSQSTANNFMRIFEEYGAHQISLFGGEANSQALGNLSYTKALALLAIPEEEREEFAETNHVADISSRELDRLIRERDEARAEAEHKEAERQAAESARLKMSEEMQMANRRLEQLNADVKSAEETRKQLEQELESVKNTPIEVAVETVIDQQAIAEAVAKAEADAKEKLRKAKEKEEKAKAALDTMKKQLDDQKVAQQKAVAEARAAALAETSSNLQRVQELEKQVALADPDAQTFKMLFEQVQESFSKMMQALGRMEERNSDVAENLRKAAIALSNQFLQLTTNK